jgi:anti-sigma factor RsiW
MNVCDQYQEQFLDYLYGLLEPAEAKTLRQHVAGCPHCQASLAKAESDKALLASAARTSFPEVRFQSPVTIPASKRSEKVDQGSWVRWLIAASVLLALVGVGYLRVRVNALHQEVAVADARIAEAGQRQSELMQDRARDEAKARESLQAAQAEWQQLTTQKYQELARVNQALARKPFHIVATAPVDIEAGLSNAIQVQVQDVRYRPARSQMIARVLDEKKREVDVAVNVREQGTGNFVVELPDDLPLTPHKELSLVMTAVGTGDGEGRDARGLTVTEKLVLSGPRYRTQLITDKPMYQPGETVRFRSLTLERFSLKPGPGNLSLIFTIRQPTGEQQVIASGLAQVSRDGKLTPEPGPDGKFTGIGVGEFAIDPQAPGGEYTLTVSESQNRFPPETRKFLVNQYERPRLNKELEFSARSYSPGAEVAAACKASRAEGGLPVANQPVTASISVDGVSYGADGKAGGPLNLRTDGQGSVMVRCQLPKAISRGQASLAVTFHDGGSIETIVRTIPIVLKKLDVQFYPEGGYLVAGLDNRVYFEARTTLDKPAELKGRLVDDRGTAIATVMTFNDPTQPGANQGMGRFEFKPEVGRRYELKIDSPPDIEGRFWLPQPVEDGIVMQAAGVTGAAEPIGVRLASVKETRALVVAAYCRGKLLAREKVQVTSGQQTEVSLKPESPAGGVYRITVYEEREGQRPLPRAERLVYRVPGERLDLKLRADRPHYTPGERAGVHISSRDENGRSVPAIVTAAVVDKSVIKLADEKTYRTLPTSFLLTSEVRRPEDLEYADFLLSGHRSGQVALDLLLGTQGWRRFAEAEETQKNEQEKLAKAAPAAAAPAPGGRVKTQPPQSLQQLNFDSDARQQVEDRFALQLAATQKRMEDAWKGVNAAQTGNEQWAANGAAIQQAQNDKAMAEQTEDRLIDYSKVAAGVALLAIGCVLLMIAVVRLLQASRERILTLATGLAGIGAIVVFGLTVFRAQQYGMPVSTAVGGLAANGRARTAGEGAAPQVAGRAGFRPVEVPEPRNAAAERGQVDLDGAVLGPNLANDKKVDRLREEEQVAKQANRWNKHDYVAVQGLFVEPNDTNPPLTPTLAKKYHGLFNYHVNGALQGQAAQARGGRVNRIGGPAKPASKEAKDVWGRRELQGMPGAPPFPAKFQDGTSNTILFAEQFAANCKWPQQRMVVREYAHMHPHGESNIRADFTETLLWQPVLVVRDGEAETASFDLCDSVTTFQVMVCGYSLDGRLGAATLDLESRQPLSVEPKLPLEITASDTLEIPITVANNTDHADDIDIHMEGRGIESAEGPAAKRCRVVAQGRTRVIERLHANIAEGTAELRLEGRAANLHDQSLRTISVVPDGFPMLGTKSDMLERTAKHDFVLPQTWIKGTLKYRLAAYPSTLADLQQGLESLLREPGGCFEQTSSSNYPNVLILDYLKQTDQAKPEVTKRASEMLSRGYEKLTSFECNDPNAGSRWGYEWFGGNVAPHEALTAYGLMEFRDMAKVHAVDSAMVERTRKYLLSRRDGKGGFTRNPRSCGSFGRAPENVTNAYIIWSLTEAGDDDVTLELNKLAEEAKASGNPYFLSLVANSLINRQRNQEAIAILLRVLEMQKDDGHLEAGQASITGSGGRDLEIETTALAVLGWLKASRLDLFNASIQSAARWIGQQRGGYGGFGATQSTILALKALIAYSKANKHPVEEGDLTLSINGHEVQKQHFAADAQDAIFVNLVDAETLLHPGSNSVSIEVSGKNKFPYSAMWSCQTLRPPSAEDCPIALETKLNRSTVNEGMPVELSVKVENRSAQGQGMTLAIIGLPAGMTLPEDLKELKDMARMRENGTKPGLISAWEIRGRELVLYWREMAPHQRIDLSLQLVCRVPGSYRGPASRAYLYYNADHKRWVEPLEIQIKAGAGDQPTSGS